MPTELSIVPDASVPSIIFEDESIAIIAKPSATSAAALLDWARETIVGDLPDIEAVTLLSNIGGLVPVAKTGAAAAYLHGEASTCEYVAVVRGVLSNHNRDTASADRVQLDWLKTSAGSPEVGRGFVHDMSLSLVRITAVGSLNSAAICDEFSGLGLCVLGAIAAVPGQKVRAKREVKRGISAKQTEGGVHLALVGLALPPALATIRVAGAPSSFRIAPPKRFSKRMTRERLEAERRAARVSSKGSAGNQSKR